MKRVRSRSSLKVLLCSLAVSAGIHLMLTFPLKDWVESYLNAKPQESAVRVVQIPSKQWSSNFKVKNSSSKSNQRTQPSKKNKAKPAQQAVVQQPKPKKKVPVKPDRQVVNVPATKDDTPNPDAKYLSKFNTNVKKETVARLEDRDPRQKRVTNKLQQKNTLKSDKPGLLNKVLTLNGDGSVEDFLEKTKNTKPKLKLPRVLEREKLELGLGFDSEKLALRNRKSSKRLLGNSDRLELSLGNPNQKEGGKKGPKIDLDKELPKVPTLSALVPTLGRKGSLAGSPSMDYVEGVREGDGTYLNTKEFKYATFIHRVSESVYPYWDNYLHTEYRRRDPTRRIYGQKDRATVVRLEIGPEGDVLAVQVQESSGVTFLDDVIVRAIEIAQPFPNPPEAMADEDGVIRLSYRFVVVLRPGRGRLFRGLP